MDEDKIKQIIQEGVEQIKTEISETFVPILAARMIHIHITNTADMSQQIEAASIANDLALRSIEQLIYKTLLDKLSAKIDHGFSSPVDNRHHDL